MEASYLENNLHSCSLRVWVHAFPVSLLSQYLTHLPYVFLSYLMSWPIPNTSMPMTWCSLWSTFPHAHAPSNARLDHPTTSATWGLFTPLLHSTLCLTLSFQTTTVKLVEERPFFTQSVYDYIGFLHLTCDGIYLKCLSSRTAILYCAFVEAWKC